MVGKEEEEKSDGGVHIGGGGVHIEEISDGGVHIGGGGDHKEDERKKRVVVVGVRLDQQSRELLTWALVKVALPGDLVIALHLLLSPSEEQTTLLALVKTFDSVLAVYEGFCHLKQVDLKLKVCRGSSLRKILVREVKAYESTAIILGTSKVHHTIRSPTSVAKYCARKLSNNVSVYAVDNGKVIFQREATPSASGNCKKSSHLISSLKVDETSELGDGKSPNKTIDSGHESCNGYERHEHGARKSTLIKRYFGCAPISTWADFSGEEMEEDPNGENQEDPSLALVSYQPKLMMDHEFHDLKLDWSYLRRVFSPKHREQDNKVTSRKPSVVRRVMKFHDRQSTMAIHPDGKDDNPSQKDDNSSNESREMTEIEEIKTHAASLPSSSPVYTLKHLPKELEDLYAEYSSTCKFFTYKELKSATSNFIPENMIGKGGSSRVYRGCFPDGDELAVKILKPSENVVREFITEIEIITTMSHKNVITLFGFCFDDDKLILVYNFLPRGCLEENLHGDRKNVSAFGWGERYRVALGVAEGLDYLHSGNSRSVIHRDIKSSNILLSDKFEPQLADFGLATWASNVSSVLISEDVAGTFGYLAPEYFLHGKVTDKIDVYAFGVVLLELLTGRKPIDDNNPKGKESLVVWANSILKDGKMCELLDPSLGSDYDHEQLERMILAATLCIRREPQMRPRIGDVLKLLKGDADIITWAQEQVNSYPVDEDGDTPRSDIQSHLNLALLDVVEDDSFSISSTEPNISVEEYLKGRYSRTSSFD